MPFCVFYIYYPICMGFGIRDLHATLLRTCEFSEKWHRKGTAFLMGVNEITFTGVLWARMTFESKERLGKVCVWRHGVPNLQSYYFAPCRGLVRCIFFYCTYSDLHLRCHFVRNFVLVNCFISGSVKSDAVGQITDTRNECSVSIFFFDSLILLPVR